MTRYLLLLSLAVLASTASAACSLPAVVFVPGYVGSQLYVTVAHENYIPPECDGLDLPIGEPFLAMINISLDLKYSNCMSALLLCSFDAPGGFSSVPGITVSVASFGKFSSISPAYWSFAEQLMMWGYEIGVNAFAAPYDYRYMTPLSLDRIGFTVELKGLVERTFEQQNVKTFLIGHSNGGPTAYSFLQSVDSSWKDKYIAGMITLSGNMLGQMNMIRPFLFSSSATVQQMILSWEASYTSLSWGDYPMVRDIPVATVFSGTDNERNYTVKPQDLKELFSRAGDNDWFQKLSAVYSTMNRTQRPHSNCYCLYGADMDTIYSFVFDGDIAESKYTSERLMNGDGNQDIVDNTFCEVWRAEGDHSVVSESFPGVSHMQMYSDSDVMAFVWDILSSYIA